MARQSAVQICTVLVLKVLNFTVCDAGSLSSPLLSSPVLIDFHFTALITQVPLYFVRGHLGSLCLWTDLVFKVELIQFQAHSLCRGSACRLQRYYYQQSHACSPGANTCTRSHNMATAHKVVDVYTLKHNAPQTQNTLIYTCIA